MVNKRSAKKSNKKTRNKYYKNSRNSKSKKTVRQNPKRKKQMAKRRPKHHSKKSEPIFKEKKDLYGLLVLSIALLFAVIIYTKASGIFGEKINEILELIFGVGKYAIPFILFAWSISFLVREEKANYKQIGIGLLITFVSILGLIHLRASRNQMLNRNFIANNGGYIGGYLTYYLSKFIGKIATSIILLLSLIISTLILTRKSLKEIKDDIKNLSMKLKFKKPILKKPHILTRESEKIYTSAELKEKKSKPKHAFEPIEKFKKIYKTEETLHNKLILYETSPTQLVMSVASVVEDKTYKIPPLSLLQKSKTLISTITKKNVKDVVRTLERILSDFKIEAKVSDVTRGPNVTLFSIQLAPGIK
ncbi:unnamed protein product, partial [marine sediment metagenome]